MNKLLIYQYINKIKKEDIKNFGLSQNIYLTNQEIDIIYNNLKNKTEDIFNNPLQLINDIKDKVSISVYNKMLELYNQYKDFIK